MFGSAVSIGSNYRRRWDRLHSFGSPPAHSFGSPPAHVALFRVLCVTLPGLVLILDSATRGTSALS